jgi:hypothetical protein
MLERPARRKGIANLARKVTLSEIRIGKRYRREMGDIGGLAASMEELGLLQPIVVTPDGTLIAGERRLRAALRLGWTHISISVVDIDAIVRGEFAENAHRKDFTLSETVAIKRALERSSERPPSSGRACAGTDIRRSSPQVRMGVPSTRSQPSWGCTAPQLPRLKRLLMPRRLSRIDSANCSPTWTAPAGSTACLDGSR